MNKRSRNAFLVKTFHSVCQQRIPPHEPERELLFEQLQQREVYWRGQQQQQPKASVTK